ncbi:hypothetical protein FRC03_000002 [Tulasnella sp. 419]|nr:hypothetical protein FRC03_000002 [Tulasnella sp. 419]
MIDSRRIWLWSFLIISLICPLLTHGQSVETRSLKPLDATDMTSLVAAVDPTKNLDPHDPNSHLSHILIPRPPGSANNTAVRNYIVSVLKKHKWHVEEDAFKANTPYGEKEFTNIIATRDPAAPRRLILSAHFDSKFFETYPQNQFVGATDSAAPCAMMLDIAETIGPLLDERQQRFDHGGEDPDDEISGYTTLQLVFFDGEEAFKDWTATDSIYGSRHLAEKWATTYVAPHSTRRLHVPGTMLSGIEHLILLDLLGAASPLVRSYFPATAWLFDAFVSAERRLGDAGKFNEGDDLWRDWDSFFVPRTGYASQNFGHIEDDHIPFLRRGVNILHMIASPFPRVWHTLADDATALDLRTMKRWTLILRVVMAEYFNLRPHRVQQATQPHVERSQGELLISPRIVSALLPTIICVGLLQLVYI